MKIQWTLILALIFALIVAIFAVVNVEPVQVDYIFGTTETPLIIVILGSALLGGFILGSIGLYRNFLLQRKIKSLTKEKALLEEKVNEPKNSAEASTKVEEEKPETTIQDEQK